VPNRSIGCLLNHFHVQLVCLFFCHPFLVIIHLEAVKHNGVSSLFYTLNNFSYLYFKLSLQSAKIHWAGPIKLLTGLPCSAAWTVKSFHFAYFHMLLILMTSVCCSLMNTLIWKWLDRMAVLCTSKLRKTQRWESWCRRIAKERFVCFFNLLSVSVM